MSANAVELELVEVTRSFRTGFGLSVPYLKVPAGSTLAILGPSGAGKSTLLEIAGLLEKPDSGEVRVDGSARTPSDREARAITAAVFQRPFLIKDTVGANVAYGLKLRRVPAAERARRVSDMLETVGLAGFEKRAAGSLSGGEAQRVALARALVLEPRLLMLDEPLSSLDLMLRRTMQREFAEILRARGVTTVYVTHDHNEALVMADDIAIMRDGQIAAHGPADEVVGVPLDDWSASFLGVQPPLRGVVESAAEGLLSVRVGTIVIVGSGRAELGASVRLGVRPEDITVWRSLPECPGSARNRLELRVTEIHRVGSHFEVVGARDGFSIAASISAVSVRELAIVVGDVVGFAFKATAVRVAAEGADERD